MQLWDKGKILESLRSDRADSLWLDPLLDEEAQVGAVSVDLRLGYDFMVSILTRKPFIALARGESHRRDIETYFQYTRRDLGDHFMLYPGQTVLTTTLEYVSLPADVYADVLTRSSYNRLGIQLATALQPGFRGTASLELSNSSNNPVELAVGSRIVQARFFQLEGAREYGHLRKYYGDVRPTVSRVGQDPDLSILERMRATRLGG